MEKNLKINIVYTATEQNSSSGNNNIIINQVLVQKYPPIRPAGTDQIRDIRRYLLRDRHRQETEQDRRFQITHKIKSPQSTFSSQNFPVGDCMNHI